MHFPHRRHFTKAIWEVVQFLDAVCQSYGELLGEELGGTEQGTWRKSNEQRVGQKRQGRARDTIQQWHGRRLTNRGLLPELDHLTEGHASRRKLGKMGDAVLDEGLVRAMLGRVGHRHTIRRSVFLQDIVSVAWMTTMPSENSSCLWLHH